MRDWYRGALIATVLVIGFFGYGHAWNAAAGVLDNQWPLIGAWALLVAIGLFVAWRFGRRGADRDAGAQPRRGHRAAAERVERGRHDGHRRVGWNVAPRTPRRWSFTRRIPMTCPTSTT